MIRLEPSITATGHSFADRPGGPLVTTHPHRDRRGSPDRHRDPFFKSWFSLRSLLVICMLALSPAMPGHAAEESHAAEGAPSAVVDINTASAEALADALERVGKVRAQAIVAWRQENGKFTSIEQLTAVPGVGASVVELNRGRMILK